MKSLSPLFVGVFALAGMLPAQAAPTITAPSGTDANYTITAATYTAEVAADGCMDSLKAGGVEWLLPGVDVSRGVYLYSGGAAKLPQISQPSPDVILAQGPAGSIQYTFTDTGLTISSTNAGKAPAPLYVVLSPSVTDYASDGGKLQALPATTPTTAADFYGGASDIRVAGADRIWGPWAGGAEVIETDIPAGGSWTLQWNVSAISPAILHQLQAASGPDPLAKPTFGVLSPMDYEVFQRRSRLLGSIRVAGPMTSPTDQIAVEISGKPLAGALAERWQPVTTNPAADSYDSVIPVPAGGWYAVTVRDTHSDHTTTTATVAHVGVGEVFVGAGQSNSTNFGQTPQQEQSGMVANFTGSAWRLANDPQLGVDDNSTGGSFWPAFGDAMYAQLHVPIGVAPTGFGGTSILQWQPGSPLLNFTMTRIAELGPQGFRALLWHQGENDSFTSMTSETYARDLARVIMTTRDTAGWDIPWFVAQVSYHDPVHNMDSNTRDGQAMLWKLGIAMPGPDTDTLTGDDRFGIHLSPKGLTAHGQMWANLVAPYVEQVLAEPGH